MVANFIGRVMLSIMRTIRRYSNRKLYDTHESHYVTLQALAALVRSGEDFQVVDHGTNRDLTTATLAQIIFEEEKRGSRLPASELRRIIQSGTI
jgi:polyhydroxyalkanoate synthesis repressor PhaR